MFEQENENPYFEIKSSVIDKEHLSIAKSLQNRLRFYTEPKSISDIDPVLNQYWKDVLGDKYPRYMQFLVNELPLINKDALLEYKKVFNKVNVVIKDASRNVDLNAARAEIKDKYYIENIVHEALLSAPNSLTVIESDISKIFILDIQNVDDIEVVREYDSTENTRYSVKKIVYTIQGITYGIDTENYYVLSEKETEENETEYTIVEINAHNLGFCPCFFNFEETLLFDSYILRTTPFLNSLPLYVGYLDHQTGRNYLESYNKYPILKTRKNNCNYQSGNHKCNGYGQLMLLAEDGLSWHQTNSNCPNKAHNTFVGAGTILQVPIPNEGEQDLWNAIEFVSPEIASLTFNKERTEELAYNLSYYLVGGNANSKMAMNEIQTQSLFERKKSILTSISNNYEMLHYNILKTALIIKVGVYDKTLQRKVLPTNIELIVSYSKEFYLQSVETLYKELENAKNVGMPSFYLNRLAKEIIITKNGNSQIDPLTEEKFNETIPMYLSVNEILLLVEKGLISNEYAQTLLGLPTYTPPQQNIQQ